MDTVSKSYHDKDDNSVVGYCGKHTIKQHPLLEELTKLTLEKAPQPNMLGAPEVLTLGENFIHLIGGKKILDIGTYTGASALAWSLATGEGGKVYTFDVSFDDYKKFGLPIISKDKEVLDRIVTVEGPALECLEILAYNIFHCFIADEKSGTFDFAFIDADKPNYADYYDRSVTLLRSGGVIMVDNALWHGHVTKDPSTFDKDAKAIDDTNKRIFNDDRTYSALINIGDGTHIAFKK